MSARGTRAVDQLRRAGVAHALHAYELPHRAGERHAYGEEAVAALGVDARRVLKTLVVLADGSPAVALVPVAATLDPGRCAAALGARRVELADLATAERVSGYVRGGISPFGLRRTVPVVVDASASGQDRVLVSAGRRGLQVELAPADLVRLTGARIASIARASS